MTRPNITRGPIRGAGLLLAAFAALGLPCLAQEGYDPLRLITVQHIRPNLLILIDTADSMNKDVNGNVVGVDSVGPSLTWSQSALPKGCTGSTPPKCNFWTYTLTFGGNNQLPSRMAVIKNALGNSVALATGWTPPASWPLLWPANPPDGGVVFTSTATTWTWVGNWKGGGTTDPGFPFSSSAAFASGGAVITPPQNILGKLADQANWGLMTFGGPSCSTASTLQAAINSGDTGTVPAGIVTALQLKSAGGLDASGNMPTVQALTDAKAQLLATLSADPKAAFNRPYGVILITDGPSDLCNPSNATWSGCPANDMSFPPGVADAIFNTAAKARVYTIGFGPDVNQCELNDTAFRGRADAGSPNSDVGFDTANDPNLPPGTYNTLHGNYAFFASNSAAISNALAAIMAGTATGDYATSAPLSGTAAAQPNILTVASTGFPSWKGHFYAYDSAVTRAAFDADNSRCDQWLTSCYAGNPTDNSQNSCIACLKWDAGVRLSDVERNRAAAGSRKIYTWDPTNLTTPNVLVEVMATNLTTLQAIASAMGAPGLTSAHVDFIRGNDGAGVARSWRLGPIINSTPALIAAPLAYTPLSDTLHTAHETFRVQQNARTALLWAGSDDGMLHAFRLSDGIEQVALLSPKLFGTEMTLYDNYKNQGGTVTGQLPITTSHVYGVANSLRFADVYFPNASPATFKTVGFLTLGPGGAELTAIDLSHPSPDDFGCGYVPPVIPTVPCVPPVQVLWRQTSTDLPGLKQTWSVPALAPLDANGNYMLVVGGGFNTASTAAAQVDPIAYGLDATVGQSVLNGPKVWNMPHKSSPTPLVGTQAFADSVLLAATKPFFLEDNLADVGIQADLNGQIWFASSLSKNPNFARGIDLTTVVTTNQQPIYYPPAASGYASGKFDVFAFASGTLYERSASVTGPNVGTAPNFEPSLFFAVGTAGSPPSVSNSNIFRQQIKNLKAATCPATSSPTDPPCLVDPNAGNNLSNASQATAAPSLLVPRSAKGSIAKAFYLVYDPKNGGNGFSYLVELDVSVNLTTGVYPAPTPKVFGASLGAASGFTITDNFVRVARSGLGAGAKATIATVPGVTPTSGGTINLVPQWWRELK